MDCFVIKTLDWHDLITAGWAKSQSVDVFAKVLLSFGTPNIINRPIARVLPWIEIVLGAFIVFGIWHRLTAILGMILLLTFTIAIGINLFLGKEIECGCFGKHTSKLSWKLVVRNVILILLLSIVYVYRT